MQVPHLQNLQTIPKAFWHTFGGNADGPGFACLLCVQDLKSMVADDAVFKADGVIYMEDTKGTPFCTTC
jgi:hypothetical protein